MGYIFFFHLLLILFFFLEDHIFICTLLIFHPIYIIFLFLFLLISSLPVHTFHNSISSSVCLFPSLMMMQLLTTIWRYPTQTTRLATKHSNKCKNLHRMKKTHFGSRVSSHCWSGFPFSSRWLTQF